MSHSPLLRIDVSGPGHHDRAQVAALLIPHLCRLGSVVVESTLRPRLAADVEALLDAGATGVVLDGPASRGSFRAGHDAAESSKPDIVVRLVADSGPCRAEIVAADGEVRAAAEAVIAAANTDG
jgi:hypothetical protein